MKRKPVVVFMAGTALALLLLWGFIAGREELIQEQQREQAVQTPLRLEPTDTGVLVVLDAATLKRADIALSGTVPEKRRGQIDTLTVVLSAQGLIKLRDRYVALKARTDRAGAALHASRREYERLKTLHADDRNISDRVLQAAEVAWRSDQATARSTRASITALKHSAAQRWGQKLTSAMVNNSTRFQRLSRQQQVLLRVAAPSGQRLPVPPASIEVVGDNGQPRSARLLSPSPQVDPRFQGPTFFYTAAAKGLLPGTTLITRIPVGAEQTGATIPAAAIIWWQGKAWFYIQARPGRFARRELLGAIPVRSGWFVPQLASVQVVVRGAQMLLSEELRGQIQSGDND